MPLPPDHIYEFEKAVWSDKDFDQMGWHDVHIHGLAFSTGTNELLVDIDYIFAWVDPEAPDPHYTFWMSPCTMIFSNVHSFTAEIEWGLGLEISDLSRERMEKYPNGTPIEGREESKWTFDCQEGAISFYSTGFIQVTRRKPTRAGSQAFSWAERGGVSFDRVPCGKK